MLIGKVTNDGAPHSFGKKGWRFLGAESQPADFMDGERTTCANKKEDGAGRKDRRVPDSSDSEQEQSRHRWHDTSPL
jgi:hypothetical protein